MSDSSGDTTSETRPTLGTQQRTVYDHAEEWHVGHGHTGDVRDCTGCRVVSPYAVMLGRFFPAERAQGK